VSDERFNVVLETAQRAIDRQSRGIDELRSRAGALLSAASLAAAFLGADVLQAGTPMSWRSWVAVIAFAVSGATCAWVLLPRRFTFAGSPTKLIAWFIDEPADVDQLRWVIAKEMEDWYDSNQRPRWRMSAAITIAAVALVAEIGAWLIELAARK
jgi:hypothetical protein